MGNLSTAGEGYFNFEACYNINSNGLLQGRKNRCKKKKITSKFGGCNYP